MVFLNVFTMAAQDKIRLSGKIFDALTSHEIKKAKIRILDSKRQPVDSAEVQGLVYLIKMDGDQPIYEIRHSYSLSVPKTEGDYVIEATSDGYEITEFPFPMRKLGRREAERSIPNIYMKKIRKIRELSEVTVKSSKVKFYHKGDTIVYNADAFDLPEGSMLDALVRQLPGVEIRDGGQIYVNGKYVESLLLNGRDFFAGNKRVMLDNLGAYMVKDIKVYEKLGRVGELMGKKAGDEQYVMDVRLKKDYMAGNLLNVEAGAGTRGRWLGKIFGLHYTNNSRISLYGNTNNLNDNEKPDEGNKNSFKEPEKGLSKLYRGGIDYLVDNPQHTWEVNGNADFSMRHRTANTDIYHTSFMPGGNTYDYTFIRPKLKDLSVTTSHKLTLKKMSWTLDVKPSFSYNHDKSTDKSVYAGFDRKIEGIEAEAIENLFSQDAGAEMRESFINRQIADSRSKGHGLNAGLFSEFLFRVPKTSDVTSVWFETGYSDYRSDRDRIQDIRYADDLISGMIRKQIMHSVPNRNFTFKPGAKYYYSIKNGSVGIYYNFNYTRTRKSTDLFLINARMEGDDAVFNDADAVFDPMNSFTSRQTETSHLIRPFFSQSYNTGIGKFSLRLSPEFGFYHRKLDYHRGGISSTPVKNDFMLRIMNTGIEWDSKNRRWNADIGFGRTPGLASLADMVDYRDTSDPLNIQEGNPELKNTFRNVIGSAISYYSKRKITNILLFNVIWLENDIVRGYRYDSASGIRTFKAFNVSGNRELGLEYFVSGYSLLGGLLNFNNRIKYVNSIYADMVGYDAAPERQKISNDVVSERLSVGFRSGWFEFGPGGSVEYRHTKSDSSEFAPFNAIDFSYGLHGTMKTPFGLQIGTDLTMNSRRGYSQSGMNDNRLLWNARATYSLMNGKLLLILQARDILGKEKNLSYSVNGQGRTETRFQILPRYVMLSAQFHIDFKPKRLKEQKK